MIKTTYPFALDLQKTLSQISIPVTRGDTGRKFLISLTSGGRPYRLTEGCRATLMGTKADGTILYNDCVILDCAVIQYDFTAQTTAAVGMVDCQLKLYGKNGDMLASPKFTLVVYEPSVDLDQVLSEDEKTSIEGILAKEAERTLAEEERTEAFDDMMSTFEGLGGIAVQDEEPTNEKIAAWVDSDDPAPPVSILTTADFDTIAEHIYETVAELIADRDGFVPSTRTINGKSLKKNIALSRLDIEIFPIGSIYISTAKTSPASLFGGTWVQLKDRFLLGVGNNHSAGETGGEEEHLLTIDEIPKHSHKKRGTSYSMGGDYPTTGNYNSSVTNEIETSEVGGDHAHNNMPPYLAVYMWERTA